MANCNHNLVGMPFTLCFLLFFLIYVLHFLCTKQDKRGLKLSEHYSISSVVVFLHCAVSYFVIVLWMNIKLSVICASAI